MHSKALARLKLVRIGRPFGREEMASLADVIFSALTEVLDSFELMDYEPPAVDEIEAGLLTQALDHDLGGHILGVTDADLVDHTESSDFFKFLFGAKDGRNQVAVVSTRRMGSRDPARAAGRVLKVALHELGHNFGLVHHYAYVRAGDGGCCPMTKGDYNRHGERSYVRSVIDARGYRFCDPCRRFLRLAHPLPVA